MTEGGTYLESILEALLDTGDKNGYQKSWGGKLCFYSGESLA